MAFLLSREHAPIEGLKSELLDRHVMLIGFSENYCPWDGLAAPLQSVSSYLCGGWNIINSIWLLLCMAQMIFKKSITQTCTLHIYASYQVYPWFSSNHKLLCHIPDLLQLDCPSVTNWGVVITFAVKVQFQIRDQFWIPQPKLHGALYLFFCKISKHASPQKCVFQGVLGTKLALWAQIDVLASWAHYTNVYLVCNLHRLSVNFRRFDVLY